MKYIKLLGHSLLAISLFFTIPGCKKYLEEYNPGSRTDENYYVTKAGFEDLVKSNYSNLRGIINNGGLYFQGTDILSTYGINDVSALNLYNTSLNSSIGDVDNYWRQLYSAINIANTTLYWATKVEGVDIGSLATRISEAKTLRAYYYFLLAETFGDAPLLTERTTEPVRVFVRTPEQEIYTQIIKDLMEAIPGLSPTTPEFGRVTKGVAQHLLAKVYLTRGYKSYGGGNADFQLAATQAEAVIAGPYALKAKYVDLFDASIANFQINSEVIFSVQYSINAQSNGGGNNLQQYFLWDPQITPILGRSSLYGKPNYTAAPTPYYFTLFDKARDSRYLASFHNVLFAQVAGTSGGNNFAVGDTFVYYPDIPFTAAEKAAKKYFVTNPNEYRISPFVANVRSHPQLKKFRDPGLPYQDGGGFRDTYVFRLAETHLIAAEAYLQSNNLTKALEQYNKVRERAAKPGNNPATGVPYTTEMRVTALTLDNILEERARELLGEELRWFELKRTGKLISRVLAYNDEAKAANTLKPFHLLRPIPQVQLDLNRGPFPQNTGY
ncbi:MAG: RagB/SusD family nutrient uptake outer membrane protein [Rhizobacter sp.]|nr:RagB/SusD family nutrient uptake outer membrane protein [Ferruginibacter sp.]